MRKDGFPAHKSKPNPGLDAPKTQAKEPVKDAEKPKDTKKEATKD